MIKELKGVIRSHNEGQSLYVPVLTLWAMPHPGLDLEILAEFMVDGQTPIYGWKPATGQWAGVLWLIPFMAEVWSGLGRSADRDSIAAIISVCLDPPLLDDRLEFFGGSWSTENVDKGRGD